MFVEPEKRIDINPNMLKAKYDQIDQLGYIAFEKTRINDLVTILNKMDTDDIPSFREELVKKIVTLCYEYNINYHSVCQLISAFEADIHIPYDIYSEYGENGIFIPFPKIYSNFNIIVNKSLLKKWENEIKNTLILSDVGVKPSYQNGNNTYIDLDVYKGIVSQRTEKNSENKPITIKEEYIFNVCPVRIVEYVDPDFIGNKEFEITFKSKDTDPFTFPKMGLTDIVDILKNNGYTLMRNKAFDGLTGAITALKDANKKSKNQKMYTVIRKPMAMGIYWDEKELYLEDYQLTNTTIDNIKKGLETFMEYASYFTEQEKEYLGTVFKWGLFAPFDYAYKQVGQHMEWIYLQGKGGTGKTKGYANMVGHMWFNPPKEGDFEIGSGRVGTKAQLGYALSRSTFPICIDESENIFEKNESMQTLMKSFIDHALIRETQGSKGKLTKGLSAAICTSNGYLTDASGGQTRRTIRINFTRNEMKSEEHKEKFMDRWHIGQKDSDLHNLQYVSHAFVKYMLDNPKLIHNRWRETVDNFLKETFKEVNMELPLWLDIWTKDLDNGLESQFEDEELGIKEFIERKINFERNPVDNTNDPRIYVNDILKSNKIVGLYLNRSGEVCITQNFLNTMFKKGELDHKLGLTQFAKNYGWKQKQAKINGKNKKVVYLSYDFFIEWVYGDRLES